VEAPSPSAEPTPSPTTRGPAGSILPLAGVFAYTGPWHLNPGGFVFTGIYPYAADAGLDRFTIDWGDGSEVQVLPVGRCPEPDERGHRVIGRADISTENQHIYQAAGEYTVRVVAYFAGCDRPAQTATATNRVIVDDRPMGTEGSLPPYVDYNQTEVRSGAEPGKVARSVRVTDDDLVAFALLVWGDGTVTVLRTQLPSWCGSSPAALDPDWPAYVEHTYPKPGRYDTYFVARMATCDGAGIGGLVSGASVDA
jgi:hypothetical protein